MAEMIKKEENNLATVERTRNGLTFVPRFDIVENESELVLYGDLPGVSPEDLDVRFENEHLTVHGRVQPRHEGREFVYGEYGIGDFYREFYVSEAIDAEQISAELKCGVLTVHLPKTEAVKPRRIEVQAS